MKKLTLPRLKSLAPQPKKKVQKLAANAAHRLTPPAFEDYDEEPSTKLSTAFVVVLILHLVAVGGIYAFHSIKAHRNGNEVAPETTAKSAAPAVVPVPQVASVNSGPAVKAPAAPQVQPKVSTTTAAAPSPAPQVAASVIQAKSPVSKGDGAPSAVLPQSKVAGGNPAAPLQPVQAGAHTEPQASALKTYTVVKGDNPVAIAKRFGVTEDELLKLNGVSDPKKLQIGQVLKVPAKKGSTN
ncbi:MAG: LysM peptidoglycan-binding domain-containing protein [Verrucomicrobiota bacterium]